MDYHQAALIIQATFRGYRSRKELKKVSTGISKLQQLFRKRKLEKNKEIEMVRSQRDLIYKHKIIRAHNLLKLHQDQLLFMELMSPRDMDTHLAEQKNRCALVIQAAWRGYYARKMVKLMQDRIIEDSSAMLIQEKAKEWIQKQQLKSKLKYSHHIPQEMQDVHVFLKQWKLTHPVTLPKNEREKDELKQKATILLQKFYSQKKEQEKKMDHLNAILLQIEKNLKFLSGISSLDRRKEQNSDILYKHSRLFVKAKIAHEKDLSRYSSPVLRTLTKIECTELSLDFYN